MPTIITAAIVTGLMLWSIPARVQVELATKRMEFVVDATQGQGKAILGPLNARSVAIDKFTTMSFEPETFEVADPSQYDMKTDDFPPSAWKPLRLASANITLAPKDSTRHPRVTVEGPNRHGLTTIRLDPIVVATAAQVTLEARPKDIRTHHQDRGTGEPQAAGSSEAKTFDRKHRIHNPAGRGCVLHCHRVYLAVFYMDKFEVTVGSYA